MVVSRMLRGETISPSHPHDERHPPGSTIAASRAHWADRAAL